jgi:hypothetical protein
MRDRAHRGLSFFASSGLPLAVFGSQCTDTVNGTSLGGDGQLDQIVPVLDEGI